MKLIREIIEAMRLARQIKVLRSKGWSFSIYWCIYFPRRYESIVHPGKEPGDPCVQAEGETPSGSLRRGIALGVATRAASNAEGEQS